MAKERLVDRVPPGALDRYDAYQEGADHRRSLRRELPKNTVRSYRYRLNHYQRWCALCHYQPDVAFLTDARAEEYVAYQAGPDVRFHPQTIQQSLSALRYYAERAGVDPMPSFTPAHGRLTTYRNWLRWLDLVERPPKLVKP